MINTNVQNIDSAINCNEEDLQTVRKTCLSKELKMSEEALMPEEINSERILHYSSTPRKTSEISNKGTNHVTSSPETGEPDFIRNCLDMLCSPVLNSNNKFRKMSSDDACKSKKKETLFSDSTEQNEINCESFNTIVFHNENIAKEVHENTGNIYMAPENCISVVHVDEHNSHKHIMHLEPLDESMNITFSSLEVMCKAPEKVAFSKVVKDGNNINADNYMNLQCKVYHNLKSDSNLSLHEDTISELEGSKMCTSIIRKRPLLYSVKSLSTSYNKRIKTSAVNVNDILLVAKFLEISNYEAPNMKKKLTNVKPTVELVPFTSLHLLDQVEYNYKKDVISKNTILNLDTSETYISDGINNVQMNNSNTSPTIHNFKNEHGVERWNAPEETSIENSVPSLFISDTQIFQIGDEVESLINALHSSIYNFDDNCFMSQHITEDVNNKSCTLKSAKYVNDKNILQGSISINKHNCNSSNSLKCQVLSKQNYNISESEARNLNVPLLSPNCTVNHNCTKNCLTISKIKTYNKNIDKYIETPVNHQKIDENYYKSEQTASVSQNTIGSSINNNFEPVGKQNNSKKTTNLLGSKVMSEYNVSINKESNHSKTPAIYALSSSKAIFPEDSFSETVCTFNNECIEKMSTSQGLCVTYGKNVSTSKELFTKSKHTCNNQEFPETRHDTKDILFKAVNSKPKLECNDMNRIGNVPNTKDICIANGKHMRISDHSLINGFQTASGKQVNVSRKSLVKAKHFFHEQDISYQIPNPNSSLSASGKWIVFEKSQSKMKTLFGDEMIKKKTVTKDFQAAREVHVTENESLAKVNILVKNDFVVGQNPYPESFQTVSGKQSSICEEYTANVFEKPATKGFHMASSKQTSVSENTRANMKMLFSDKNVVEKDTVAKGFCMASGKQITITEESLAKVKMFKDDYINEEESVAKGFQEASDEQISGYGESIAEAKILLKREPLAKGFQMASGKQVIVSKESLAKAKMLFSDDNVVKNKLIAKGFCTASGKQVSVSEKSLAKVKTLFSDKNVVEKTPASKGFEVANEKEVSVSTTSIAKEKLLNFHGKDAVQQILVTNSSLVGREKQVSVPTELETTAKMLLEVNGIAEKETVSKDFETASISKDLRAKAKYLFHDEAVAQKAEIINSFPSMKQANVSEESLTKATLLFNEDSVVENDLVSEGFLKQFKTSNRLANLKISVSSGNDLKQSVSKGFQTSSGEQVSLLESQEKMKNGFNNKKVVEKEQITHSLLAGSENQNKKKDELYDETELLTIDASISFTGKKSFIKDSVEHMSEDLPLKDKFVVNSTNLVTYPQPAETQLLKGKQKNTTATLFGVSDDLDTSLSLVHEVSEITAAFLADEEISSSCEAPDWLKMYVTSPSVIQDRLPEPSSILCYEREVSNVKQTSPVLGFSDRFVKRNKPTNNVLKENQEICRFHYANPLRFRPPFNTSTPIANNNGNITNKRKFKNSFYAPVSKRQKLICNSSTDPVNHNVIEMHHKATEQQQHSVEYGKQYTPVIHCQGSHLLRKQTESGIPLRAFVSDQPPKQMPVHEILMLGIKKSIIEVTSDNAVNFRFSASDYYSHNTYSENIYGVPIGNGALLIFDSNHTAGIEEVTRCFLSSPGVDPSRISSQWVRNHYRWIILKMACTERSYPYIFGNRYLTPNNLLLQLKYRYDREVDQGQRPALRKILEKDESAAKPVVLFVSSISCVKCNEANVKYELQLSDGWYSVTASIDHEMAALVYRKVFVGTKLLLCGAELSNCGDGCDPLYVSESVRLKISTNSCRRARWHTRLGFCNILPNIPGHVSYILPRGGNIYLLTACVMKVYPLLYIEKQTDGKTVTRSERAEYKESELHQRRKEELVDTICLEVEKELDQESHNFLQHKRTVLNQDISRITNPEELCAFVESTSDSHTVQTLLSEDQIKIVTEYRQNKVDHMYQQLQERIQKRLSEELIPRIVTPLLKVRLTELDFSKEGNAVLSIWRPSEEIVNLLNEGAVVKFHNITACGHNRNGELLLSVTPQTRYELLSQCTDVFSGHSVVQFDCCTSEFAPLFSEVDIVGIVIEVNSLQSSSLQIIYVADANFNLFAITFWNGLKSLGCDDLLVPSAVIAASNLQWCQGTVSWNIPCAYAKEISNFTTDPHQKHLRQALQALKSQLKIKDGSQYISKCLEKLHALLNVRNTGGAISYSLKSHRYNTSSSSPGHSGIVSSEQNINEFKIHGCDNEQLLQHPNKKLALLKEKMCKLEKYGEPPPLTPVTTVLNRNVKKEFRCPIPMFQSQKSQKPYTNQIRR